MFKKVVIIALFFTNLYAITQEELAIWVEHSVRQSVRIQKMTKEALLIKMGVEPKKNSKRMEFTVNKLREDLKAFLGKGEKAHLKGDTNIKLVPIKDKNILSQINDFKSLWDKFEKRVVPIYTLQNVSDDNVNFLIQNNHKLLLKSQEIENSLTKLAQTHQNRLKYANDLKYASKIKMLSQMISKDMLIYIDNIEKKESLKELNRASNEIDKIFNALYYGNKEFGCKGTKFPPLIKQIKLSQKIWHEAKILIKKNLTNKKLDKKLISTTIAKLDKLRVSMRKSGVIYIKSIKRQKQNIAINNIVYNYMNVKNSKKHLINIAGRQRMLTQRISKLSIECYKNLRENSCINMLDNVREYNRVLRAFKKGDKELKIFSLSSAKARNQLKIIDDLWYPFVMNVINFVKSDGKDIDSFKYILNNNVKLLRESNKLVKILQKEEFNDLTDVDKMMLQIVNIAGKNRMLSQKMTKEYLEYHILNKKDSKENMLKTIDTFDTILTLLLQGNTTLKLPKVTNLKIKKQLVLVQNIWSKLKPLYLKENLDSKKFNLLLKANPILLQEMNKAVYMIDEVTNY